MLLKRLKMSDSFLHKHQSALDSQREQSAIDWRFGDPIEDEPIEDKHYPMETDYEPTDDEVMSSFGTKWHDWL